MAVSHQQEGVGSSENLFTEGVRRVLRRNAAKDKIVLIRRVDLYKELPLIRTFGCTFNGFNKFDSRTDLKNHTCLNPVFT